MNQLCLILPLARRRDPQTSKAAATRAASVAPSHRNIILAAIAESPATVKEVAERTGLTQYAVSKRLPELERMGLIAQTGVEREGCREFRRNV